MKKDAITAITMILAGNLLATFNGISGGILSAITAIIGFIIFFMGLSKLKTHLDSAGKAGITLIFLGIAISILGLIIDLIPGIGGIIATIFYIAAYLLELFGFIRMKGTDSAGKQGKTGIGYIIISLILVLVGVVFMFFPFGSWITGILSIFSLFLVVFGWIKVQAGFAEAA